MSRYTSFSQQCYELLKQIPKGKVTTYGEIARAMKSRAWRAVGSAMAKNDRLITIPCHRVVRSNGDIGLYAMGPEKKAALLQSEGIEVSNGRVLNIGRFMHRFSD